MIRTGAAISARLARAVSFTLLLAGALGTGACQRPSGARTLAHDGAPGGAGADGAGAAATSAAEAVKPPPRLPEDPEAGRKSHEQWQAHMEFEERERQLGYDRRKMKEHRALLGVLLSARKRYDAARTPAAVAALSARTPALVEEAHRRLAAIDHWGVNSRLLPDYQALLQALSDTYPAAVTAALNGDRGPLKEARADLDQRVEAMRRWLKAAAESEDE